ncbi:MAG: tyrosine-type recombinase/integrase [Lachnospiraceae bacterium]|nr:tyrosine-type recombinase/integrase [Lachnospiraceae bacterium]
MPLSYHEQMDEKNLRKLRELMKELPTFSREFFIAMEIKKATNTRRNYAYDLSTFFYFLKTENPYFRDKDIRTLPVSVLDDIQPIDIEEYLSFLTSYEKDGQIYRNHEEGKARKLATLNTFFGYYHKKGIIEKNAPSVVDVPRVKEKNIIRLDANEVAQLIDNIESGEKLSRQQKVWHQKNKIRDLAIVVTLLGTGVRVTELVGLDLTDLDFDNGAMRVIRKGGNEDIVYFGEETEEVLRNYLDERLTMEPEKGHENALFISQNNTRITVRSVERLVKKYASTATAKRITPHKLRSTYGTALYQETGDIYLVADVLGHKNVNTTRKHYAAMKEENKRRAANIVQLREKKPDEQQ